MINDHVVQGPGEKANVQQEQARERKSPVEDCVSVLWGYGPHVPLSGGHYQLWLNGSYFRGPVSF